MRSPSLSPRRLAAIAVARPRRVLAMWGGVALIGFVLIGGLLGSALSSEGDVTSYLDPRGDVLVSSDAHATILPLVLAGDEEESIQDVLEIVQGADGAEGFAVDITGEFTVGHDFQTVSEEDLRKGELQFGLPAEMIALLPVFGTLVEAAIPLTMALISIVVALG